VARISFTGGPESARHVLRNSTENFAEVSLELGGKSPFLAFEDADIESAARHNLIAAGTTNPPSSNVRARKCASSIRNSSVRY
jgi:acyl-CoA reductase-like NAD-dependent aldehyde dehydrogenase